jgi:hypothetical protein|tara:strand:- start:1935 stop:2111 length:177 start_codon:yes stop_codon:yes gene_type:complete
MKKYYHIYYKDKCIFKLLTEDEFDFIWNRMNMEYNSDYIESIEMLEADESELYGDASY